MTDSPTRKKRFGSGICWEYMDRGSCPCDVSRFPAWHPRLCLAAPGAATSTAASCGAAASTSGASCAPSTGTVATMPKRVPEWIESLHRLGFVEGDPDNFAVLSTSYEEREEAKALGAVFSPGMKRWIVIEGRDLVPFARWRPRVRGRGADEVVMHSPTMDRLTAVRELRRRCGFRPSHLEVRGGDGDAYALRKEISAMQRGGRVSRAICHGASKGGSDPGLDAVANAKRPCFSTPESRRTSAGTERDGLSGATRRIVCTAPAKTLTEHGARDDLSELLTAAKSALVRCNGAGSTSREQKLFNESIYATMEALAAKLDCGKENIAKENVMHKAAAGPERADRRQARVTPPKNTGADGKAPGAAVNFYNMT